MVAAGSYRKLARKANVEYPLLSDPGREWLESLGSDPAGEVGILLVGLPSATVLGRYGGDASIKVPQLTPSTQTSPRERQRWKWRPARR